MPLLILGVTIFLFFKYQEAQRVNQAVERMNDRYNDDLYFEKLKREQEDDILHSLTLQLISLTNEGKITEEEFNLYLERIQNKREEINSSYPNKFTQEELEEVINDANILGEKFK